MYLANSERSHFIAGTAEENKASQQVLDKKNGFILCTKLKVNKQTNLVYRTKGNPNLNSKVKEIERFDFMTWVLSLFKFN